jgi:hypothetical protein
MALLISGLLLMASIVYLYRLEKSFGVHGAVIEYEPNKAAFSLVSSANTNSHNFREAAIRMFLKVGLTRQTIGKILDEDMTQGFLFIKPLETSFKEKRYARAEPNEPKAFHARVAYFHQDLEGGI